MLSTNLLLSVIALLATPIIAAPGAATTGSARVHNLCSFPIYLWSVGSSQGPMQALETGKGYAEVFHTDAKTGGIALKITRSPDGLFNGSPQTTLAYSLDGDNIWYDLSNTFGDTFSGMKLEVKPSVPECPSIVWGKGVSPGGSQTKVCGKTADVVLTTCAP